MAILSLESTLSEHWNALEKRHVSAMCLSVPAANLGVTVEAIKSWSQNTLIDHTFLSYDLAHSNLVRPYEPLIDYLIDCARKQNQDLTELVDRAPVYPLHRNLWRQIFRNQRLERDEDLLAEECEYEQHQLRETFLWFADNLLPPVRSIVVISGIERAPVGTFSWLRALLNRPLRSPVMFVFVATGARNDERWEHFNEFLEEQFGEVFAEQKTLAYEQTNSISVDVSNLAQVIEVASDHLVMLSLSDAISIGNTAYTHKHELIRHSPLMYVALLHIIGDAYVLQGDSFRALAPYEEALETAHTLHNVKLLALAYRRLYMLFAQLDENSRALEYAQQAIKFARASNDECVLVSVCVPLTQWGEFFADLLDYSSYLRVLEIAKRTEKLNNYAFASRKSRLFTETVHDYSAVIRHAEASVSAYQSLNNQFGMAAAFHELGIAYGKLELIDEAIEFHRQSLDLRLVLGSEMAIVRISNGTGYLYSTLGEYGTAIEHYLTAIRYLPKLSNWGEIGATLYNVAYLYFLARDFERAMITFEQTYEIMRVLNVDTLVFHTRAKITALLGICLVKCGNVLRAARLLSKVQYVLDEQLELGETRYYIGQLEALVNEANGHRNLANYAFERAAQQLDHESKSDKRLMSYYYGEYGRFLTHGSDHAAANRAFAEGEAIAKFFKQPLLTCWIEQLSKNGIDEPLAQLPDITPNSLALVELARRDAAMKDIHRSRINTQFRDKFHDIVTQTDPREVAKQYVHHINTLHDFDVVALCELGGNAKILSHTHAEDLSETTILAAVRTIKDAHISRNQTLDERGCRQWGLPTHQAGLLYVGQQLDEGRTIALMVLKRNARQACDDSTTKTIEYTLHHYSIALMRAEQEEKLRESLSARLALQEMNAELESRVREYVTELQAAYEKLERQHNDLERQHTRYKTMQQQLIQTEKMSGIGTLVSGICHEINNPTNFIAAGSSNIGHQLQNLEQLLYELADPDEQELMEPFRQRFTSLHRQLAAVEDGAKRIREIVSALRLFARGEVGSDTTEFSAVEAIKSAIELVRSSFKYNVDFVVDENDAQIVGAPSSFTQIMTNILINGCQAIIKRNKETGRSTLGQLTARVEPDANVCKIIIEDDGCGIPADVLSHVFEPFFTTHPTGHARGLGLSTAFAVIDDMGGTINIHSTVDVGTRVEIQLPKASL